VCALEGVDILQHLAATSRCNNTLQQDAATARRNSTLPQHMCVPTRGVLVMCVCEREGVDALQHHTATSRSYNTLQQHTATTKVCAYMRCSRRACVWERECTWVCLCNCPLSSRGYVSRTRSQDCIHGTYHDSHTHTHTHTYHTHHAHTHAHTHTHTHTQVDERSRVCKVT